MAAGRRIAALVVTCGMFGCGGADLASSRVTAANIERVSLGMSEAEVVAILGTPIRTDSEPYLSSDAKVMTYSRPARGARWYPMLWVHLQGGVVTNVYAKRYVYWGFDDEGIYNLIQEDPNPDPAGLRAAFPE
jgi:hypothetical protein